MEKSNTLSFAETELDLLVKSCPPDDRPIVEEFIPEILALVEKFGQSGQSGGSAPYTAQALSQTIKKLCLQQPICPITGEEYEWYNVGSDMGRVCWQNARCSALFMDSDKKAYYLHAITWKTQTGATWSGTASLIDSKSQTKVWSRQYIKSFPFTPKTFVIDVIEKEVAKDDWEFYVKDQAQLKEVFEYYDEYNPNLKAE